MNGTRRVQAVLVNLILLAGVVLTLFPLVWMFSVSLMPANEAVRFPPPLWPEAVTLEHYRTLFGHLDLGLCLRNSLLVASLSTILSVLLNSLAGYAFAKFQFAGRDRLFRWMLAAMVIPGQVAMLPLYLLLKHLGLVNTFAGVIVPGMASIFGIFLIRQFVRSIPDSLLDAARIDGASELRIYWSLVLPLCRPILVTLAVFTFLGSWSDFLWPLIVLTDSERYTLPVALANLMGEHVQDTELMMAAAVLTLMPVLLLFLALQRYYMEGLTLGGVKE
ncbi:carbohydrate ABC transporter permease [Methyloterricola oryzae]|uniref:carbohydrate ABC transporter permease n=1 Tax=Methyloterricola oryzae TaxID=1495050 RepID=UPI0005EBDB4B|nr:carbohydrate ABC transporter permease [Methyloterricola oryzae]